MHGSGSSPLYEHVDVVLSTIHEVVFEVWSQKTRDLCYAFVLKILGHSLELSPKYLASSFLKSSWLQDLSDPNLAFVCNSLRPASIHSATAFRYHISYSLATSLRPPLPASPHPASPYPVSPHPASHPPCQHGTPPCHMSCCQIFVSQRCQKNQQHRKMLEKGKNILKVFFSVFSFWF